MDIPDLVQQALGGEEIRTGISLGDEDVVYFTPTRALVYNGEGLISDEGVEEFSLDTERLSIKRSRRKTRFVFQYIEGPESFTVPSNRGEDVLERLLEGILRVNDVLDPGESVAGVYLFSELTLAITDKRIVKHIGNAVWDEDFEVYDFADVTGLDFEQTSVATSIVVGVDGRPQRVKVPTDNAPIVRRTLQEALFEFHDVSSLEELNRLLGDDERPDVDDSHAADDLTMGSGIDPLVTDRDDDPAKGVEDPFAAESASDDPDDADLASESTVDAVGTGDTVRSDPVGGTAAEVGGESGDASGPGTTSGNSPSSDSGETTEPGTGERGEADASESAGADAGEGADAGGNSDAVTDPAATADPGRGSAVESGAESGPGGAEPSKTTAAGDASRAHSTPEKPDEGPARSGGGDAGVPDDVATREDVAAVADRLEELTDAVDRQNELLKRQHRAMKQLVERLDEE